MSIAKLLALTKSAVNFPQNPWRLHSQSINDFGLNETIEGLLDFLSVSRSSFFLNVKLP